MIKKKIKLVVRSVYQNYEWSVMEMSKYYVELPDFVMVDEIRLKSLLCGELKLPNNLVDVKKL